ncbi:low molecular weight protein-tyrosine-phosphatase [Microvirga sp. W0021]|uniref:protein-tyrosine-phosphatase n=1 Tax=Hohaiivirga grylli TaxID=3133970 RepID=A0ABV0BEN9_9HYPH
MPEKQSVLFVCLGNICRSPLAEAAMRSVAEQYHLDIDIDSAGTGNWHKGEAPDERAQRTALRHGVDIGCYRARQITQNDFYKFSHIIALDRSNLETLLKQKPADSSAIVRMLLDYVPGRKGEAVADPYYGTESGFEVTWQDAMSGAQALVRTLMKA